MNNQRLNIGCGRDYKQGWVNIDISQEVHTDVCMDITKDPLPFADETVQEIYISGVLEQIGPNDLFMFALNECNRVLVPGGTMTVIVPNAKYAIAHRDPMDIRKMTPDTFAYFDNRHNEYRLYGSVYGFKPWVVLNINENARHILTVTMKKEYATNK